MVSVRSDGDPIPVGSLTGHHPSEPHAKMHHRTGTNLSRIADLGGNHGLRDGLEAYLKTPCFISG
jgi:hypothetical protein